ncbi:hypothetical protein [Rhizobium sp. BK491]|uniref:hypothetical protein n=1 Tax=Rhizobium sp. BK491 TaxID=2587009 RepID=UPI0013AF66C6|nr:hypothetical protein [Rhizobium sp. BK491]MBB3571574.1 hypothetical protein [Rhizobium sp. BK491]
MRVDDEQGVVVGRYAIMVIAITAVLCVGMALYLGAIKDHLFYFQPVILAA